VEKISYSKSTRDRPKGVGDGVAAPSNRNLKNTDLVQAISKFYVIYLSAEMNH
jgi:hypothetical protein